MARRESRTKHWIDWLKKRRLVQLFSAWLSPRLRWAESAWERTKRGRKILGVVRDVGLVAGAIYLGVFYDATLDKPAAVYELSKPFTPPWKELFTERRRDWYYGTRNDGEPVSLSFDLERIKYDLDVIQGGGRTIVMVRRAGLYLVSARLAVPPRGRLDYAEVSVFREGEYSKRHVLGTLERKEGLGWTMHMSGSDFMCLRSGDLISFAIVARVSTGATPAEYETPLRIESGFMSVALINPEKEQSIWERIGRRGRHPLDGPKRDACGVVNPASPGHS